MLREEGGAGTNASPAQGPSLSRSPTELPGGACWDRSPPLVVMGRARGCHLLCLLWAELLGMAMLKAGGPGWGGVHIKGGIEVNVITEGRPAQLQAQHLYRGRAIGKTEVPRVTWRPGQRPEGSRDGSAPAACSPSCSVPPAGKP